MTSPLNEHSRSKLPPDLSGLVSARMFNAPGLTDMQVMDMVIAELVAHRAACAGWDADMQASIAATDAAIARGEDMSAAGVLKRLRAPADESATA